MLIFESDLLNALDFLFIISGAPIESIEERLLKDQQLDRAHSLQLLKEERDHRNGFFLIDDQDHFSEIFFLKMSFLDQIVHRVFPNLEGYQHPELGCSLDRIWIQLADACNMIPRTWSFKVRIIQDDLDKETAKPPSFPKSSPAYGYYFLGMIWLFTLVLNRRQGSTTICSAAEKMVAQNPSPGDSEKNQPGGALDPVFYPENIYWKPDANRKPNTGDALWEKSIQMGLSLFREGLNPSQTVIPEDFIRELDSLRAEIRKMLFQRRSSGQLISRISHKDLAIHHILVQMRNRLSEHTEESHPLAYPSVEERIADEEDLAGTVVLNRDSLKDGHSADIEETHSEKRPPDETIEPDLPKTEIIRPAALKKNAAPDEKIEDSIAQTSESEMAETVVLQRGSLDPITESEEEKHFPEETEGDDDLVETVMVGREGKESGKSASLSTGETAAEDEADDSEDLMETVALSSGNSKQGSTPKSGPEADDLEKTLMLRGNSGKSQTRKPDDGARISPEKEKEVETPSAPSEDEDIPQTVIVSRKQQSTFGNSEAPGSASHSNPPPAAENTEEDDDDDDIMSETVILKPGGSGKED
ncbi:MAG: hypothetical protein ACOCWY_04220 [Thermodesulfobacteriota bacterium]